MTHTARENGRRFQALAWLAIVVVLLTGWAGCSEPVPSGATPFELELGRAAAAAVFAFAQPDATPPQPTPEPQPGEQCQRCDGTGRIKPDGRIEIACPDCDGDGKLGAGDFVKIVAGLQSTIAELQKPAIHNTACLCGEDCQCRQGQSAPTVAPIRWYSSMGKARREAELAQKPILIHFVVDPCEPCERMEQTVFSSPGVRASVSRDFIPCRVDLALLSPAMRNEWGIHSAPADVVVSRDWRKKMTLQSTFNAADYLQQLEEAKVWAETVVEEAAAEREKSVVQPTKTTRIERYCVPTYYYDSPVWYGSPVCVNGVCW